jgi:2-amino-4-hydroxy-6-hydroxymethyldihydropteridine diphosphokinase
MTNNKIFTVYIGLGSNEGKPKEKIESAVKELEKKVKIIKKSSIYQTEPVGENSTKNFFNMVIKAETNLSPYSLLENLLKIEESFGRNRSKEKHWGDRPLDLDILSYDDIIMNDYRLTLPHKEMFNRIFVLEPFLEIEPNAVILNKNISKRLVILKRVKKYYIEKVD